MLCEDTQSARGDRFFRLLEITPAEQKGGRDLIGDFREASHKHLSGPLGLDLGLLGFVFLIEFVDPCAIVKNGTASVDVQARVIPHELLLLFGPFVGGRRAGCASCLAEVLRKFHHLLVENLLDDSVEFDEPFGFEFRKLFVDR